MPRFFEPEEVKGLKPELVALLDEARDLADVPFRITSGYRSPLANATAGGVSESSHTTGEAVDLAVASSGDRLRMLAALFKVGFTRVGVYDRHIHVDISRTLPQNVCWVGRSH